MRENPRRRLEHNALAVIAIVAALTNGTAGAQRSSIPGLTRAAVDPAAQVLDVKYEQVLSAFEKLPAAFVENRGQADRRVRYYAQGSRYGFFVTGDEVMFAFVNERSDEDVALALRFVDRNPSSQPE